MDSSPIPFNRMRAEGNELEYVAQSIASGHVAANGPFTGKCVELLRRFFHNPVLLTASGTQALELSAHLLDFQPGDEVLIPSFAYVTTASAFVQRSATPVFVDVRPDTLNIDEKLVRASITPRTKAIVALHYAGVGCEMDALEDICADTGVKLVEDNAHGLFGTYAGRNLGSFGCLSTLSFHETKNFACGEGGALVVNDPELLARAETLREKGTDRARFDRGLVDKYTWIDLGSSYGLSDLLAAVLLAQLERRDAIQARRKVLWNRYHATLAEWATAHSARRPEIPAMCEPPHHIYHLILPESSIRTALLAHLRSRGVHATFHFLPLHLSKMGRQLAKPGGNYPVAEELSECLVRLPLYNGMSDEEQDRVLEAVLDFQ